MIVYMVFTYVIHTERYMKIQYIEIYRKYVIGARDTGDVRPATRDVRPATPVKAPGTLLYVVPDRFCKICIGCTECES